MDNYSNKNYVKPKEINISVNVIKCVAIFAVICIHCGIYHFGDFGVTVEALARFGVPIFFLISGFYSYYQDNNYAMAKYKTRMSRLLKLLIIGIILYVAYYMIFNPNYHVLNIFKIESIINYILFNVSPAGVHLWFLEALLYCYILFYLLSKFNINPRILYYLVPFLLYANILLGEVSSLMQVSIDSMYYRNFLFTGLPFFTLGYLVREKQDKINEMFSNAFLILSIIATILLVILESSFAGTCELYLGTIFLSLMIFIWCVKNPQTLHLKLASWIGGNLYSYMYVLHILVIFMINPKLGYLNPIIYFIITAAISSIIYYAIKFINSKSN